jgi:hypothetical protein
MRVPACAHKSQYGICTRMLFLAPDAWFVTASGAGVEISMYEVVESAGEWIVLRAGQEVARYCAQAAALQAVAERLREEGDSDAPVSFGIRFSNRS